MRDVYQMLAMQMAKSREVFDLAEVVARGEWEGWEVLDAFAGLLPPPSDGLVEPGVGHMGRLGGFGGGMGGLGSATLSDWCCGGQEE